MQKWVVLATAFSVLSGCGAFNSITHSSSKPLGVPETVGAADSGYTYIPVDPFAVEIVPGAGCVDKKISSLPLLDTLPDNAVRMLVESFDLSGKVTFGASKAGVQNQRYQVTVDYISADTINVPILLAKAMWNSKTEKSEWIDPISSVPDEYKRGSESFEVVRVSADKPGPENSYLRPYNIPVYVGIGLRVSANVYVTGANANISGIGIIGAEAEAKNLTGSLTVQTLGVNGKSVAAALPIQSELNRTTAQNAITAVASIKALLYADETVKEPRVVGLYLPFNGGVPLVNALISALSKERVEWARPCVLPSDAPKAREASQTTSATVPRSAMQGTSPASPGGVQAFAAPNKGIERLGAIVMLMEPTMPAAR